LNISGPLDQALTKIARIEKTIPFENKIDKAVWRGTASQNSLRSLKERSGQMWRSGTSRKAIRYRLRMCVSISISSTPRYKLIHSKPSDKYLIRHKERATPGVFHTIKPAHQSSSPHHSPCFSTTHNGYLSEAAENCYWRSWIRAWSRIAGTDEADGWGMGIRWEPFTLQGKV